jgi:hypothetical protein
LYGSPETEKIGSFWDTTSVLKRSIMGIPVRIMFRGMMRSEGLTEGPPMGMTLSFSAGPLSLGSPEPENTLPSRSAEKGTCMGRPRKRTVSPVEMPRPPAKTWSETSSPWSLFTSASEVPNTVSTSARSP